MAKSQTSSSSSEPSDPAPSDPAPSDPAPSDPAPSDPAPSDPSALPVPSFEFLVEAINEGIMLLDIDGEILYVNGRMAEMLGHTRDHMIGAMLFDFMSDKWARQARKNLARRSRGVDEVFEHDFLHARGHPIQTLVASRFIRVADNERKASLVAITDISERARAVESLRLSEETFRTLSENSPDGIIIHRHDKLIYANPAVAKLLGYDTPAQLADQRLSALVPEDQWADVQQRISAAKSGADNAVTAYEEHQFLRRSPDRRNAGRHGNDRVDVATAHFQGVYYDEPAVISLVRDITRRKALQAKTMQLDRLLVAGTLAAGVGHEVNNPLAFLSGHLELAYDGVDDSLALLRDSQADDIDAPMQAANRRDAVDALEDVRRRLNAVQRGATRIRTIIEDLRLFTGPHHDKLGSISVTPVVETAIQMANHELPEYGRLIRDFDDVPDVIGAESDLGQVILNILINAAQAIAEAGAGGDHRLRVSLRDEQSTVAIEVADTGVGIAPEVRDQLFDPFFTTKDPDVGTGLGLSISKNLVERLGGTLTVEPTPGPGACFRVELQVAADDAP